MTVLPHYQHGSVDDFSVLLAIVAGIVLVALYYLFTGDVP